MTEIACLKIESDCGQRDRIEGTTAHPVWSVERQQWVPLAELRIGETLQAETGLAHVVSITLTSRPETVYNLEVHGEHVYQVGSLGLLVHNDCVSTGANGLTYVGRTNDFLRREAEHLRSVGRRIVKYVDNLSLSDARGV